MLGKLKWRWRWFWTRFSGPRGFGKFSSRLAAIGTVPFQGREFLATFHPRGYVAPTVGFGHDNIDFGKGVYVGDGVNTFDDGNGPGIKLHDRVSLYGDTIIHTGRGGGLIVEEGAHIQPGCFIGACVSDVRIGRKVEIASRCAFYSFGHGVEPDKLIMDQSLTSKGPITVGDGAWLGHGVVVLAGVRIGEGAVVGSGSVVAHDIPDNAIAAGVPARIIKNR